MIHKPSRESLDVPQKNWARSVQPFRRLLDTNRQTDKPNLYIDKNYLGTISEPRKLNCLELSRQLYLNQRNQTKNCGTGRRNFNHTYAVTKQIV